MNLQGKAGRRSTVHSRSAQKATRARLEPGPATLHEPEEPSIGHPASAHATSAPRPAARATRVCPGCKIPKDTATDFRRAIARPAGLIHIIRMRNECGQPITRSNKVQFLPSKGRSSTGVENMKERIVLRDRERKLDKISTQSTANDRASTPPLIRYRGAPPSGKTCHSRTSSAPVHSAFRYISARAKTFRAPFLCIFVQSFCTLSRKKLAAVETNVRRGSESRTFTSKPRAHALKKSFQKRCNVPRERPGTNS